MIFKAIASITLSVRKMLTVPTRALDTSLTGPWWMPKDFASKALASSDSRGRGRGMVCRTPRIQGACPLRFTGPRAWDGRPNAAHPRGPAPPIRGAAGVGWVSWAPRIRGACPLRCAGFPMSRVKGKGERAACSVYSKLCGSTSTATLMLALAFRERKRGSRTADTSAPTGALTSTCQR